ncbi:MAG: cupin domain-containing protein [Actinobacteria bacterium]|nr:cupin domain-containing protein [Actinomycetota bacterium]
MTGLARCVGDVPTFLDRYWGRAPLFTEEADPAAFRDLFSLEDVDRLVSSSFARLPAFRLVREGRPVPPSRYTRTARLGGQTVSGVGDPGKVLDELQAGATIVLQGLQRYWPPLSRFCRALELELTHPVQANAYVTPAGSRGLSVHYDTHDVFVLQVAGGKEWAVHDPVLDDPLPSQPWSAERGSPDPPFLSPKLQAGDSLYIPRGFLHSAQAQEDLSVHLTIGVLTQTWHDVLREVVTAAAEEPRFRQGLPAGFAHDSASSGAAVLRCWRASSTGCSRWTASGTPPSCGGGKLRSVTWCPVRKS